MLGSNFFSERLAKKLLKIDNGGVKFFNKIDYIMFPACSMGEMLQKIGKDFGSEYLFELGYEAGKDGSNEMFEKLGLLAKSTMSNIKIINIMFETLGFGRFDIKYIRKNSILFHLTGHPVIEYGKMKFGKNSKICSHYAGIFSIHAEKELKVKDCKLKETQCITKGDKFCEFHYNYFK